MVPIQRSDPQQGSIGFIRLYIHRGSVQRLCWVLQGLELKFHGKVLCERLPLPLFVKVRWRLQLLLVAVPRRFALSFYGQKSWNEYPYHDNISSGNSYAGEHQDL